VLVGAIGVAYSMKVIFIATGCIFAMAIIRTQVFEGRRLYQRILGNMMLVVLMTVLLFFVWKMTPKPKEPPSADEIANAVIKKQREEVQKQTGAPLSATTQPTTPSVTQKPSSVTRKPRKSTRQPSTTEPSIVPSQPQSAKLIVSQKPDISTRQDASYKTVVTIQTTADFPTLKLLIHCDKPLVDGQGGIGSGGVLMMTSQGIVKDHPNYFIFTYQSASPTFGPQNPIVISLWSKEATKCDAATY